MRQQYLLLRKFWRFSAVLILLAVFSTAFVSSAFAYNDWLLHKWWVTPDTRVSGDFQVVIRSQNASNGTGNYANYVVGWLAAKPEVPAGFPNFIQVGILSDGIGVRWFAYTTSGTATTCLRGAVAWGSKGCIGAYNDYVGVGQWSRFELVNYGQGFWIARVWSPTNTPIDVAKLYISQINVTDAYSAAEQAYSSSTNLQLQMDFLFYNPQYMKWGTGFRDWPKATGTYQNFFSTTTNVSGKTVCPPYGQKMYSTTPPYWYSGKGPAPYDCLNPQTF